MKILPFVNSVPNDGSNYVNPVRPTLNAEPNPDGIIGDENRPWNMSVNYIIKVK